MLLFVENAIKRIIFISEIYIEEGDFVGECARRGVEMYEKSKNLICYNNRFCYVDNFDTFFKKFCCPGCDSIIKNLGNISRQVKLCKYRAERFYPKRVYTLQQTLFNKLDRFGISYNADQKTFKSLAIFDFESISVPAEELKDTNITNFLFRFVSFSPTILSPSRSVTCNSMISYVFLEKLHLSIHSSKLRRPARLKGSSHMNGLILQTNLTQLFSLSECFFSKIRDHKPLEKEFISFTKLLNSGLSKHGTVKKLRLKEIPPSGVHILSYLKKVREEEQMSTFRDLVKWYNSTTTRTLLLH